MGRAGPGALEAKGPCRVGSLLRPDDDGRTVMIGGSWEVVIDGLGRLEAPCLDPAGQLCFSDIAGDGAIYRLGHHGPLEAALLRRSQVGRPLPPADRRLRPPGRTPAACA